MKALAPLIFIPLLLVSACASTPQDMAAQPASVKHSYQCESGEAIAATYPTHHSATVQYKGSTYNMQSGVSGSMWLAS